MQINYFCYTKLGGNGYSWYLLCAGCFLKVNNQVCLVLAGSFRQDYSITSMHSAYIMKVTL